MAENTPVEFVRLLYEKWIERHPPTSPAEPVAANTELPSPERESHSIFLSYAHADAEPASRLHEALLKVGLNVWMDKRGGLTEGDLFDDKIRRDIARCTLFMPLLSSNTEKRGEAYFRQEWNEALRRLPRFKGSSRPFIVPVIVDDLDIYLATAIPEEFKSVHIARAPQGILDSQAAGRFQQIIRNIVKAEGGLA